MIQFEEGQILEEFSGMKSKALISSHIVIKVHDLAVHCVTIYDKRLTYGSPPARVKIMKREIRMKYGIGCWTINGEKV